MNQEDLDRLTTQMNLFMERENRKLFPTSKVDELRELGAKRCPKCATVKNVAEFGKDSGKPDGLRPRCRACKVDSDASYREANKERIGEYIREHRRNRYRDPEDNYRLNLQLHSGYRRATKAGNTAVRITPEELLAHWESIGIDPLVCYLTGETLTPLTRSLDHIVAIGKGGEHTVDNLAPCTWQANDKKNTLSAEEARELLST